MRHLPGVWLKHAYIKSLQIFIFHRNPPTVFRVKTEESLYFERLYFSGKDIIFPRIIKGSVTLHLLSVSTSFPGKLPLRIMGRPNESK